MRVRTGETGERGRSSGSVLFYRRANYVIINKTSINVKANQATIKTLLHDTILNGTTQWIKIIYSMPEVRAQESELAQRFRIGPTLGSYKGAVVFALVMFQKCSVFTSQF